MDDNWTGVHEAGAPTTARDEPGTHAGGDARGALRAIQAFEDFYRTSPGELAQLSVIRDLPPEARRALASLLSLSAPAREALIEALTLPEDVRAVVVHILDLPGEAQEALRALLSA